MSSQTSLLIYIFGMLPGMLLGFYFARTKRFSPHHKGVMTTITIVNWIIIGLVMVGSYVNGVAPGIPASLGDVRIFLPTIHLVVGGIAQLLATYLVILMWTERTSLEKILPIRIKNIKTPMRVTLTLWILAILLGVGTYFVFYGGASSGTDVQPVATEEASSSVESTEEAPAAPESTEEVQSAPETTEEASSAPESTEEAPATPETTEVAPESTPGS
jgi:uncharacterized membrane protein YozB (DUF420 family)